MWTICKTCGVVVADQALHATVCHPTTDDPTAPAPDDGAPTEEDSDGDE